MGFSCLHGNERYGVCDDEEGVNMSFGKMNTFIDLVKKEASVAAERFKSEMCIRDSDRAIRCGNDTSESVYDSRGLLFI